MAQVTLKINGHVYTVGCNDGEEQHVQAMGEAVEKRIEQVKALGAQSGEARMLVMAALLMADELHDKTAELDDLRKGKATGAERVKAERLNRLATRAEEIAASAKQH